MQTSKAGAYISPEIEKALQVVTEELRWWKVAMEELAAIFHARYPPIGKRNGWTLHVRRCAKSKACDMCPHSILWVQYCYVPNTEETKRKLRAAGKPVLKYTFIWASRKKAGPQELTSGKKPKVHKSPPTEGLPPGLRVSRAVRANFQEFEDVRTAIMGQHRVLAKHRKKLLAKHREAVRRMNRGLPMATASLEAAIVNSFSEFLLSNRPVREDVSRKMNELRRKFPPSDKRIIKG